MHASAARIAHARIASSTNRGYAAKAERQRKEREMADYLTSEQIRAARAMLRLAVEDLARAADIPVEVLIAIEASDGQVGDNEHGPAGPLRDALEMSGIEFLEEDAEGGVGIRLMRPRRTQEGIRPENLTAANDD
jgi:hypothetical protein